jgi:hypothetical protein
MRMSTVLSLVSFPFTFENTALKILLGQSFQGTLTEREGYTIDLLVQTSLESLQVILQKNIFYTKQVNLMRRSTVLRLFPLKKQL